MPPAVTVRLRLAIAFVASLVLHLALAALVRAAPEARASADEPPAVLELRTPRPLALVTPRPTSPPTATPKPVRTSQPLAHAPARPRVRLAAAPARVARVPRRSSRVADAHAQTTPADAPPRSGDGDQVPLAPVDGAKTGSGDAPVPAAEPTASPTPSGTPKPACANPNAPAHTIDTVEPDVPEIARSRGATGTASVRVDLTQTGAVRAVSIARSTGDPALDAAALEAARRSTYAPEVTDCAPQPGSYLFRVEFDAG